MRVSSCAIQILTSSHTLGAQAGLLIGGTMIVVSSKELRKTQ